MNLWRKLWKRLHVHCWTATLYNGYCAEVEQHCPLCGAYRHHTFEDIIPLGKFETRWHDGRHPNRHLATEWLDRARKPHA